MPTLREFVERAQEYGCVLKQETFIIGPKGPEVWRYLKRGDRLAMLPDIGDDELIVPTKLRSMIDELNLPPLDFWLKL